MDLGLKDKPVIVLASSGGIGRGCALEFAREKARVMLFGRDEKKLKESQAVILKETGQECRFKVGDITKPEDVKALVEDTAAQYGGLWALVNNTGGPPAGPFMKFDDPAWQSAFELTLLGYIRAIRNAVPVMQKAGGGRIVNISSSSIKRAIDNLVLSNVFRMGVLGLTKSVARELGASRILVNTVGPGKIKTERVDFLDGLKAGQMGKTLEQFQTESGKAIPLGRYGDVAEIGRLVVFLCSEANTYVSGQGFLIDGAMVEAY